MNNYCVYVHKRKTDDSIFYVGSGTESKRPYHTSEKSSAWNEVVKSCGFYVEILYSKLSKVEARLKELELINSLKPTLVNKRIPLISHRVLDKEHLNSILEYDVNSPTFLVWKVNTGTRGIKGKPAGYSGGRQANIKLNKKSVPISRVIWTLFYGQITEDFVIDHIDGNPLNNNINNLRKVTYQINAKNRKISSSKSTKLPSGITLNKQRFQVSCVVENKRITKSFSLKKYGTVNALIFAMEWRNSQLYDSDYSERHLALSLKLLKLIETKDEKMILNYINNLENTA